MGEGGKERVRERLGDTGREVGRKVDGEFQEKGRGWGRREERR